MHSLSSGTNRRAKEVQLTHRQLFDAAQWREVQYAGCHRAAPTDVGPDTGLLSSKGAQKWQDQWLLMAVTAGSGQFAQRGSKVAVERGDIVLAHRDSGTSWVATTKGWTFLFARFEPACEWSPPNPFQPVGTGLFRAHTSLPMTRQRIEEAFQCLQNDLRRGVGNRALQFLPSRANREPDQAGEWIRSQLMLATLAEIFLLIALDPCDTADLDPRIVDALDRMSTEMKAPHTVESLARHANLSPSRFAHLFAAETGVSPMRALREIRLQQSALELFHTDDSITAVASRNGFTSLSDFSRRFRRAFGVSPRQYRVERRS